jgi:hypothetical protein
VSDSSVRRPKRETIVEGVRILVLKLYRPSRSAIFRLIDAKICRIVSDGHQISNVWVDGLDVAELQRFGSRYYARLPRQSAVRSNGKGAISTARPDNLRVHWAHRDQTVSSTAVLGSNGRLFKVLR